MDDDDRIDELANGDPVKSVMLSWFLRLTEEWQDVEKNTLSEAELDVIVKLVCMGLVTQRQKALVTSPGSDVKLSVTFDSCGFDRIDNFLNRDVIPTVQEWAGSESVGVSYQPEAVFQARLTAIGQDFAAGAWVLAEGNGEAENDTAGENQAIIDGLLSDLDRSLVEVAKDSTVRFAKLSSSKNDTFQ